MKISCVSNTTTTTIFIWTHDSLVSIFVCRYKNAQYVNVYIQMCIGKMFTYIQPRTQFLYLPFLCRKFYYRANNFFLLLLLLLLPLTPLVDGDAGSGVPYISQCQCHHHRDGCLSFCMCLCVVSILNTFRSIPFSFSHSITLR